MISYLDEEPNNWIFSPVFNCAHWLNANIKDISRAWQTFLSDRLCHNDFFLLVKTSQITNRATDYFWKHIELAYNK